MPQRLKTFIVEDSPLLRESLIAALEELAPIDVMGSAEDEDSAVRWIGEHRAACDLLITDIFLKQGSGLGVLAAVMSEDGPINLIVLSNYATTDMRRRCTELGANRIFDKSNEIDALVDYCARLASRLSRHLH